MVMVLVCLLACLVFHGDFSFYRLLIHGVTKTQRLAYRKGIRVVIWVWTLWSAVWLLLDSMLYFWLQ